mgnify:CR=1 FL=1
MLRKCLFAAAACAALGFTASSAEASGCARGGYGGYYGGYGPRVSYYHGYRPTYYHRAYRRPYYGYGPSYYGPVYGGYPRSGVSFSFGF